MPYIATSTTSTWQPVKNPLTKEQYVAFAADSASTCQGPWEKHLLLCAHDALKAQLNSQHDIHLTGVRVQVHRLLSFRHTPQLLRGEP
jgi:hypothetical protein